MAQTTLSAALLSQVAAIVAPAADKLGVNDLTNLVNNVGTSLLGFAERAHMIETDRVGVGAPPTNVAATSVAALNAGQPSAGQPSAGQGDVWDDMDVTTDRAEAAPEPAADLPPEPRRQQPAHPIEDTVHPDYIISLEDGKPYRVLTRHLKKLNMTPEEYRKKWGLSGNYPMVAPNFTIRRREIAVEMGFGKRKGGRTAQAAGAAATNELPPATQEGVIDGALAASLEAQGQSNEYVGGEQPALPLDQVQAGETGAQAGGDTGTVTTENNGEAAQGEAKSNETPAPAPAPRAKKTTSSRAAAKVEPKAATKTEPKKATGKGGGRRKAAA